MGEITHIISGICVGFIISLSPISLSLSLLSIVVNNL